MDKKPDISTKKIALDTLSVLSKGAIAQIPIFGAFVVEALNTYIPDQRLERLEKILQILSSKFCNISVEELQKIWGTPEFLDMFEDCMNQGIRAISDERLEYLASVLEKSLTEGQIKHLQTKRLLSILGELNDSEIIILQSYGFRNPRESEFRVQHKDIFQHIITSQGASEEEQEGHALYINYEHHLINSGLIGPSPSRSSQLYLTPLGKMLLKLINRDELVELAIGTSVNPVSAIRTSQEGFAKIERDSNIKASANKDGSRITETQQAQKLLEQLEKGRRYDLR